MAQATADVVALQLEQVRDKLPVLFDYEDTTFSAIDTRKDVIKTSSRAVRIPIQDLPGSRFGSINLAGGAGGRGTATHYDVPQETPLSSRIAIEINEDALKQTNGEPQAIRKLLNLEIKNAMSEFRRQMNGQLQTAGNGVLATVTAAATGLGGTITVKTTPFYAQLLRPGQIVQIYDSTITTNRGQFTVLSIDYPNSVVTATADTTVPAATVATDVVLPEGLSGATPTWYFGIPYHLSDAATGTWLNLNRANVPAIRANHVSNAGAALTTAPIRLILTKILQRVGLLNAKSFKAHLHPTQRAAYEELAVLVTRIEKGSGNEPIDMLFGDQRMAGVSIMPDIHAARDRIDFMNFDSWGKIESSPIDFLKTPDGRYFTRPTDLVTGSPVMSILFYVIWFGQFFTDNPAAQGYVDSLAIPTGYDTL